VLKRNKKLQGETRTINGGRGEIVIYQPSEGGGRLEVRLEQESLWLSLNQIAAVFERDKSVISRHLNNVFREGELDRGSTVAFFATVQDEGGRTVERQVEYFNLDAIPSVGYRVNSKRGTQFRIWATGVLREHLTRGLTINRQRLEENAREIGAALVLVRQAIASPQLTTDMGRGIYAKDKDYDKVELAGRIFTPGYVSFETVLVRSGINFLMIAGRKCNFMPLNVSNLSEPQFIPLFNYQAAPYSGGGIFLRQLKPDRLVYMSGRRQ
jgi:hypothetical protein